jgi:hypothetical protein
VTKPKSPYLDTIPAYRKQAIRRAYHRLGLRQGAVWALVAHAKKTA